MLGAESEDGAVVSLFQDIYAVLGIWSGHMFVYLSASIAHLFSQFSYISLPVLPICPASPLCFAVLKSCVIVSRVVGVYG
jgi:hypothetical protein